MRGVLQYEKGNRLPTKLCDHSPREPMSRKPQSAAKTVGRWWPRNGTDQIDVDWGSFSDLATWPAVVHKPNHRGTV